MEAIEAAGYRPGQDIAWRWIAASELYEKGRYRLEAEKNPERSSEEMVSYYGKLLDRYPPCRLRMAWSELDWKGWKILTENSASACSWSGTTSS